MTKRKVGSRPFSASPGYSTGCNDFILTSRGPRPTIWLIGLGPYPVSIISEEIHLFTPHPNLSDAVNRNIIESEIEGGVFLDQLRPQCVLQIQTQHRCYTAVMLGGSQALISGHPEYCPVPTLVAIAGSTWGGSMLKRRYVGRGMRVEFLHPEYSKPIVTSRVEEIRECAGRAPVLDQAGPEEFRRTCEAGPASTEECSPKGTKVPEGS